jgi:Spy/CpxP family protein refolding chaperone
MKRWAWILLAVSLALNVGLLSAAAVHLADMRRAARREAGLAAFDHERGARAGSMRGRGRGLGMMADGPGGELLRHWPDRRIRRLTAALDLRPEQQERLRRSLGALRGDIRSQAGELMRERTALHRALMSGAVDDSVVHRRAKIVGACQARLDSLAAEAMVREMAVLTPAQRERYQQFQAGPNGNAGPGR